MAVVTTTTIGGGLNTSDSQTLRRYFMQTKQAVSRRRSKYTQNQKNQIIGDSVIDDVSQAWNALSDGEKTSWNTAGSVNGMSGYNLFTADKTYRVINNIVGNATPSINHQYKIGHLFAPQGAGDVRVMQVGNTPFLVPINLNINYKSSFTPEVGGGEYLKVYFTYYYTSGESTLQETDEIELNIAQAWTNENLPCTQHANITGDWELTIQAHNIYGDLWFDNFYSVGANSIITKDPQCEEVEKKFGLSLFPESSIIETIYPVGNAL